MSWTSSWVAFHMKEPNRSFSALVMANAHEPVSIAR
jgi:hypothetical protein